MIAWRNSIEEAKTAAQAARKPIFVDFFSPT
jgi:hypothetical protein